MSLLIPITDLLHRPGNMRQLVIKETLSAEIGTPVARIPVGGELEIELRLESVHEGILATGKVLSDGTADCSRCLDEINLEIEVDFQELFAYSSTSDDELVVDGEHIDIEQVVIDSVVLNLPFQPICSESCSGLCPECGLKLSENPEHEHEKPVDSRFEALKDLYSKEE
jgi:uncharacterized protein